MEQETAVPESPLHALPLSRRAHEFVAHEMLVLILGGRFRAGDRLPPGARARGRVRRQQADRAPGRRRSRCARPRRGPRRQQAPSWSGRLLALTRNRAGQRTASARSWRRGSSSRSAPCALPPAGRSGSARTSSCWPRSSEALEQVEDGDSFPVEIDIGVPPRRRAAWPGTRTWRRSLRRSGPVSAAASAAAARGDTWTRDDTVRIAAQHRAVFEALRAGDAELSGFEMERHLRTELARLVDATSTGGPPSRFFA